jgi:protocatechuate 3,4-dioxygenase beta subunit
MGVAGITVVLRGINDAHQRVTMTTTTGADGSYSFTGLLPGTYRVRVRGAEEHVGISHIKLGVGENLTGEDLFLPGHHGRKQDGDFDSGNEQD